MIGGPWNEKKQQFSANEFYTRRSHISNELTIPHVITTITTRAFARNRILSINSLWISLAPTIN